VLAAALGAAAFAAHSGAGTESTAPCAATVVHYTPARAGTPWVAAGRAFTGDVFYYSDIAGDGRVNQNDGLVAYAGVPGKLLWVPRNRRRAGSALVVTGRRLDGAGTFTQRVGAVPGTQFPSRLTIPDAGCWRLALRSGRLRASVVVQAVARPGEPRCDPTPVIRGDPPHPRFGRITWLQATPRTSGVAAIRFVSVVPGASSAVVYAGGLSPEGWATKFLWWAPHPTGPLVLTGRRIGGAGRFEQDFGSAASDDGVVFPSIVEIPTAGCWAVTVAMGQAAGLVVFQAVVT
jgi:hypothetical protein